MTSMAFICRDDNLHPCHKLSHEHYRPARGAANIARNGLAYCQNVYDRKRYERLLELSCGQYAGLLKIPVEEVREKLSRELGHITPKLGSDAAIFNDAGEVLLMDRADGRGWCLPCGWVEPNERPIDTAVRETREETGLEVVVRRLVGVFSRPADPENGLHSMSAVVHLCEVVGGELRLLHEGLALHYWPLDEVPRWLGGAEEAGTGGARDVDLSKRRRCV